MKYLAYITFLFWWMSGIAMANGFWSTFFAVFFAPWGMYLVVEKVIDVIGWLPA